MLLKDLNCVDNPSKSFLSCYSYLKCKILKRQMTAEANTVVCKMFQIFQNPLWTPWEPQSCIACPLLCGSETWDSLGTWRNWAIAAIIHSRGARWQRGRLFNSEPHSGMSGRGEGEKFSWPIGTLWIIKVIGLISSITLIWPRNMAIWWKETKEGGTN